MCAKVVARSAERWRVCTFSLALTNPTSAWLRGVLIVTSPSLPSSVCQRSSPVSETIGSISGSGAGRLGLQSGHEPFERMDAQLVGAAGFGAKTQQAFVADNGELFPMRDRGFAFRDRQSVV